MKIAIIGPPGSGKGTMAQMLSEHFNIIHVSTGDLFRHEVAKESDLGKEVSPFLEKGELVPDQVVLRILDSRLEETDAEEGFVLDGFPRTKEQAELLEQQVILDKVIYLKISDKTAVDRISRRRSCPKCGMVYHADLIPPKKKGKCDVCGESLIQRDDEKQETVNHRLQVYHKQTEPLIRFYRSRSVLLEIDGEPSVDVVFEDIISRINAL